MPIPDMGRVGQRKFAPSYVLLAALSTDGWSQVEVIAWHATRGEEATMSVTLFSFPVD